MGRQRAYSKENLHKLQEMHLIYSTRSILEVVKDESFLRTYWRADKDTHRPYPLDISSIGNDAPPDEKAHVVKSTFYRPNLGDLKITPMNGFLGFSVQ